MNCIASLRVILIHLCLFPIEFI